MPMGAESALPQRLNLSRLIPYTVFGLLDWFGLVHDWVGGAGLDRKFVNAQHSVQLRAPAPHWGEVSAIKYWIQYVTEVGHVIVVCVGLLAGLSHFIVKVSKQ